MSVCLCGQVLLRVSVHVAISLYSVISIIAGIMSLLLPIETKGREMTVSRILICCALVVHDKRMLVFINKIAVSVTFLRIYLILFACHVQFKIYSLKPIECARRTSIFEQHQGMRAYSY